jgi:phospholipase C
MPTPDRSHALDHIVVVLFENRSLDNVLGHLYDPEDGKTFDGVIGKDLSNPIPPWAEHGAERKVVPYTCRLISSHSSEGIANARNESPTV